MWSREEQLAYIQGVQLFDYNEILQKEGNRYFEVLDTHNQKNIVGNFILRIYSEVQNAATVVFDIFEYAISVAKKLVTVRNMEELKQVNKIKINNQESEVQYSLKQIIVAVTKSKAIYGIDSKNGEILWM